MKISLSIPASVVVAISAVVSGCASKPSTSAERLAMPSHHVALVMPSDGMLELMAMDDSAEEGWEWARNDPQLGNRNLPRDTPYRIVETRQREILGVSNGRPRDWSFTRIRTFTRESR